MNEVRIRYDAKTTSKKTALNTVYNFLLKKPPYYFRDYGLEVKRIPGTTTIVYTVVKKVSK